MFMWSAGTYHCLGFEGPWSSCPRFCSTVAPLVLAAYARRGVAIANVGKIPCGGYP